MKLKLLVCTLLITLSLCSCKGSDINDLKIYVIPSTDISQALTDGEIVNAVKNSGRLVFEGSDIDGYNWENHTLTFNSDSIISHGKVTKESGGSRIFKVDDSYLFVIVIKNELVYYGGFEHGSKNPSIPVEPCISDVDDYTVKLTYNAKYATQNDKRSSELLYNFFDKYNLFLSNVK